MVQLPSSKTPSLHLRKWYPWFIALLGGAFVVVTLLGFQRAHGPASGPQPVHQWLGLLIVAGMVAHLVAHWSWLARVTRTTKAGLRRRTRGNYAIAVVLGVLVLVVAVSGVGLGGLWGEELARASAWKGVHHLCSKLLLLVAGWHVVRHRRWIVGKVALGRGLRE